MATHNRFTALDDEVSAKLVESSSISEAVSRSLSSTPRKSEDSLVSEIVTKVLLAVQPIIVEAVTTAVTTAMTKVMGELTSSMMIPKPSDAESTECFKKEVDRLEQYSRRENVRVFGLPEGAGKIEDTSAEVVRLAADMGLHMTKENISVSHRLPGRGKGPRPVIVKFVRRSTKVEMLRAKKKLKNVDGRSQVFVEEDLTPLRSRMMRAVRQDPATKSAWSIDGKIFCIFRKNGKEEKISVESADDQKKLGFSSGKIKDILS